MAAGEYISMRAQTELFERELERERQEIHRRPEVELQELVKIYESRGISKDLATQVAEQMMADRRWRSRPTPARSSGSTPIHWAGPCRRLSPPS